MARTAAPSSIDALVQEAIEDVVKRASVTIARALAELAAERLEVELQNEVSKAGRGRYGDGVVFEKGKPAPKSRA